jgi:hypothetical protein
LSTSLATSLATARIADIGVDLDQEIAPDRHRLAFGVVDVRRDDRPAPRHFVADEFGGDIIGDRRAKAFAVAHIFGEALAAQIFALGDIFHFRRDDAAPGIMHLRHIHAGLCAQHLLLHIGEGGTPPAIGAKLAVVLRAHLALAHFLDIAARDDPVTAQFGRGPCEMSMRHRDRYRGRLVS